MNREFIDAYLHAAAYTQDPNPPQGEYPALATTEYDTQFVQRAERDCAAFLDQCTQYAIEIPADEIDHAGRDFWYTRNGHGCGFWDGDWPDTLGDMLDFIAKRFSTVDDQVFADGRDIASDDDDESHG